MNLHVTQFPLFDTFKCFYMLKEHGRTFNSEMFDSELLVLCLQHLYNLVHVDLSYNSLRTLEAAHTRLGNIKTLSLAGNQLENLTGLSKLYSLVNLDLSHNQLAQLEEIRNIGALPCLEKLNLSSNPMCIIPDYRTKVLAQFGDRAAEVHHQNLCSDHFTLVHYSANIFSSLVYTCFPVIVTADGCSGPFQVCLDCKVTTEKELDTVEVLKAIQKAKEVKDRMSNSDKKVKAGRQCLHLLELISAAMKCPSGASHRS
ncbi:hypothetical protein GOODEAATRI_023180 [Goodea atripinnis]|uniref:Uncharacterized protein n=1 Tax=Goodea atripinnis TaxID=208336 RepID=A0ABV0MK31_9TELE